MTTDRPAPAAPPRRVLDVVALKALAHPLRTQLWDALMTGPATASQLAERLGESSGLTSYHLRQLAKHGFIEEVPGRGTARERFWRVVEAETRISAEHAGTPAGREALSIFGEEWLRLRFRSAARFHERKRSGLESEWAGAAIDTDAYLCATRDELAEMVREYTDVLARWQERLAGRGQEGDGPPGSRTVEVQFRAFPRDPRTPAPFPTDGESTGGREI
ncbi:winged helix-turn-helix domain-containing protein [Georgenia sp. EYE_87]|uniref:winged helix-turn-helix domain-containing protein n=1 Tax=Georgenia sp. EYE_87 TaxID=2853448 RepID=UPI002005BBC2|nr:winged helix-turn-helix domain-containing protein [Georgenia sp. EYE_87]MCK6209313.1 winged helix-turn-helix domain-containing protein [Georgenia sp. EYE_87]